MPTVLNALPSSLTRFQLSRGVQARLMELRERQDSGEPLSIAEQNEVAGLGDAAEFLMRLQIRAERAMV